MNVRNSLIRFFGWFIYLFNAQTQGVGSIPHKHIYTHINIHANIYHTIHNTFTHNHSRKAKRGGANTTTSEPTTQQHALYRNCLIINIDFWIGDKRWYEPPCSSWNCLTHEQEPNGNRLLLLCLHTALNRTNGNSCRVI